MPTTATQAPTLAATIIEVQGIFEDDQTLQDAIARLTLAGFDRADLSLPIASPAPGEATPELGAATPTTDIDRQQMRTLGASAAAATGAIAAAGITIATGGLAAAAAAAAVSAIGCTPMNATKPAPPESWCCQPARPTRHGKARRKRRCVRRARDASRWFGGRMEAWIDEGRQGRMFFFEKKNQKTSSGCSARSRPIRPSLERQAAQRI
jgi:hypothetical protein